MDSVLSLFQPKVTDEIKTEENGMKVLTINGPLNKTMYENFLQQYVHVDIQENIILDITTEGGEMNWIYQIAQVLYKHQGNVTARISKYAYSGGTILALACNDILISHIACLGTIDPQIHGLSTNNLQQLMKIYMNNWLYYIIFSPMYLLFKYMSILFKAVNKYHNDFLRKLLLKNYTDEATDNIISSLTNYIYHNGPIFADELLELDLHVSIYQMPMNVPIKSNSHNSHNISDFLSKLEHPVDQPTVSESTKQSTTLEPGHSTEQINSVLESIF